MGVHVGACVLFLFQLSSLVLGEVFPLPSFDVTQKDLQQQLSLGNINLDVPALYVFGDSFVDAGNNNYLKTKAKADHPPYGSDFGGKATGRNTNGRLVVDFIAKVAGLPYAPPALGMSEADKKNTVTGVNYASASSGVLPEPPQMEALMGDVLSFDEQIALFEKTTENLKSQFSTQNMSKSLFFIHSASNDFGLVWMLANKDHFTPEAYASYVADELSKRLQKLYALGARKFLVNNVSPLGCQPYNIMQQKPTTACVEEMNQRIAAYNKLLPKLLSNLQSKLPGSTFVLGDLYKIFEDVVASPASYGFTNVKDACCFTDLGKGTIICAPQSVPCQDRNDHVYYDPFHPTERMHLIWATRLLKDSSVVSPMTLVQLMQA
ncbi:hypothetical protein SLA2020_346410 [Shorea laevis]